MCEVKNKKHEAIYISMLVVALIGVMLAGVYSGYIDKNFLNEPKKYVWFFPFGTFYYWYVTLFL